MQDDLYLRGNVIGHYIGLFLYHLAAAKRRHTLAP